MLYEISAWMISFPCLCSSDLFYDGLKRRVILKQKGYFSRKNLTGSEAFNVAQAPSLFCIRGSSRLIYQSITGTFSNMELKVTIICKEN